MAIGEIYLKLAVSFPNDAKVRALARFGADAGLARDLYVQMCLYCKDMLSDGNVPDEQIGLLVYPLDVEHGKQLAKQLASVGLIKEQAGGWEVLAYLKRNGSREDVERLSQVRAEAGRQGGRATLKRPRQRPSQAKAKQVALQNGSRSDPYTESDTETDKQTPTESGADAAPEAPNVGHVVAAFVEGATASGQKRPATSICARVGKQARQLIADGYDITELITSARTMGSGEWNDLAVQVRKDGAATNGHAPKGDTKQTDYTDEDYQSGWKRRA